MSFAGYIVIEEGKRQNPELVETISEFPAPKDLTNLRSFMGLINCFTDTAPDLKHTMIPWQGLLKKDNAFVWGIEHEEALAKVKEIITNPSGPVLKHFDPKLPIQLLTDASRTGLGHCLVQTKKGSKDPLLIMTGSRFLSPAENNYAVVELELLAIQWRVEKCRMYLSGAEFLIVTDHQPLLRILNRKNLDTINNIRIQRLMAKLLVYSYKVEWVSGKNHVIADALSRAPVFAAEDHILGADRLDSGSNLDNLGINP